ncbi:uncharacterized protein LOC111168733 [Delphinapterus leucas]|uniref:Uncharacterized protein LOC111168733 n=1 Tax=Delphinapterus leucas TaxID=9749 RepID=A0A7F8K941_DELLE|nr:uncharacterized protein LOC111168733 [Delphinapterus leucas]
MADAGSPRPQEASRSANLTPPFPLWLPLPQPRLARRLPLNRLWPRPASAASVTSTWGRDFLLRAPLGLGTQPALRGLKGGGRRTRVGFLVGLRLRPRTPEKASPPRRSGVFLHCRRCPFRLRSSLGIPHISRGWEPEGRAWPSGSCSSACAASGRRDLTRRDGLGLHPACGTVSRGPSAPAGRVPQAPVAGAVEVSTWRVRPDHRSLLSFLCARFKVRV